MENNFSELKKNLYSTNYNCFFECFDNSVFITDKVLKSKSKVPELKLI